MLAEVEDDGRSGGSSSELPATPNALLFQVELQIKISLRVFGDIKIPSGFGVFSLIPPKSMFLSGSYKKIYF